MFLHHVPIMHSRLNLFERRKVHEQAKRKCSPLNNNHKLAYECVRNSTTLFFSAFVGFICSSLRMFKRPLPRLRRCLALLPGLLPFGDAVHTLTYTAKTIQMANNRASWVVTGYCAITNADKFPFCFSHLPTVKLRLWCHCVARQFNYPISDARPQFHPTD